MSNPNNPSLINTPRVGIGVLVFRNDKILLGKRRNAHGVGLWAPPGGHLEFGETPEVCAMRELKEETGMQALMVLSGPWTNDIIDGKHYVSLFMVVKESLGEPKLLETEKCEGWQWFGKNELPQDIFQSLQSLFKKMSFDALAKLS